MDGKFKEEIKGAVVTQHSNTTAGDIVSQRPIANPISTLLTEKELAEAEIFLKKYIASDKSGIKTINDGIAIYMRARDLRLPFSTCVEHIHSIQGKTGVDVHIIKTLLIKGSVTWECIDDYRALYEYTDGINVYAEDKLPKDCVKCISINEATKKAEADTEHEHIYVYPVRYFQDFGGTVYKDYQFNDKFAVAISVAHANKLKADGKFPVIRIPAVPIDYLTTYEFTRFIGGRKMVSRGSFTYTEAVQAGCFEKDTYKKYTKVMIGHRAFIYGARDIADDLIMGCMSVEELKTMNGIDLTNEDVIDITDIQ